MSCLGVLIRNVLSMVISIMFCSYSFGLFSFCVCVGLFVCLFVVVFFSICVAQHS